MIVDKDLENWGFRKHELLDMGAEPLSENEFYGYLKLEKNGKRYIFEPENTKNLDNCIYTCRHILLLTK